MNMCLVELSKLLHSISVVCFDLEHGLTESSRFSRL